MISRSRNIYPAAIPGNVSFLNTTPLKYGQSNIILATAYELALAGVNVYIASFAPLRTRISRIQELIVRQAHSTGNPMGSISFRECKGFTPFSEAAEEHGVTSADFRHPPGLWGALESYRKLSIILHPRGQEGYLAAIKSCKEIIADIKPNLVMTDTIFYHAMDACNILDQKFMLISPNSILEVARKVQPHLAVLWKYPVLSSGFGFPLKWWQIPLNTYLGIRFGIYMTTAANMKEIRAIYKPLGIKCTIDNPFRFGKAVISPALPEIDFPYSVIPEEMRLCGPIFIPFVPLEESDPALAKWLDNSPTVLINLGSHVLCDEKIAREIAGAIRIVLGQHEGRGASNMQVLWKAKANEDITKVINDIIGKEVKEGRVKVLVWLDTEPVSILQHPNVVCTVHHGGANSFYEGIWSGVPHIVLPVWFDTYQYATRVEFLSIGVVGNKSYAPDVEAEEFGKALVRVTGDSQEAASFRMAAKRLREVCRAKGKGRELASLAVLKELDIRT